MALNFKVSVYRKGENLHMTLTGDFDGGSAQELLGVLRKCWPGASRVFVHTNWLGRIDPFGRDIFLNNFQPPKGHAPIIFTGEKASRLAPEQKNVFVCYRNKPQPRFDRIVP